jgi:hypothetical protein
VTAEADEELPERRHSRRAIIGGAVAAGAGIASGLLLTASPADAADGNPVLLGVPNSENFTTFINNEGDPNTAGDGLDVTSVGGNGVQGATTVNGMSGVAGLDNSAIPATGFGVTGTSFAGTGVAGNSIDGPGVVGTSDNAPGVTGTSVNNWGVSGSSQILSGVYGTTTNQGQSGVLGVDQCPSPTSGNGVSGVSTIGTGVNGQSTGGTAVAGKSFAGPGVTGFSANNFGVIGSSDILSGVKGTTTNQGQAGVLGLDQCVAPQEGVGVSGLSTIGTGVLGNSPNGIGVAAESSSGTALLVDGVAKFSRSGVATVASGQRAVTVGLAGVTPNSLVLATLQNNQSSVLGPQVWILAATPGAGSFTIVLSGPARPVALRVAWIVFDPVATGG